MPHLTDFVLVLIMVLESPPPLLVPLHHTALVSKTRAIWPLILLRLTTRLKVHRALLQIVYLTSVADCVLLLVSCITNHLGHRNYHRIL
jgi:hypothetical protein